MNHPECVNGAREHSWYRWDWSRKNARYERECSLMGCTAFQYLEGTMVATSSIVTRWEGKEHVHEWSPWGPVEEFHVKDNRFYDRRCRNCKGVEETEDLREIGKTVYFQRQDH